MDANVALAEDLLPKKIEDKNEESPSFHCYLLDTELVHKIAQTFLPGLGSACVDSTTGDIFKTPGTVAVDIRAEMVQYLTQRSESFVAESVILEGEDGEVSDHPFDIISDFIDDFASLKRNVFSRVSERRVEQLKEASLDMFMEAKDIKSLTFSIKNVEARHRLDIGEGREVNLIERCPRWKLQQQWIKYLGPAERTEYEVVVEGAKFMYKKSGKLIDTTGGPKDAKWIFVLGASKSLYVEQKNKGTFQHSSFLAGGAALSAGRLIVENGVLKSAWPHSRHYLPTEENFHAFMSYLCEHAVDTENLQNEPAEEEERNIKKSKSLHSTSLDTEICKYTETTEAETSSHDDISLPEEDSTTAESSGRLKSQLSRRFGSKVTRVEIPPIVDEYDILKKDVLPQNSQSGSPESPSEDGYETAEESFLSDEDDEEEEHDKHILKATIVMRIDSL